MEKNLNKAHQLRKLMAGRFAQLREDTGLSQTELSEEIGVTQNIIFRAEHHMNISTPTLLLLYLYYYDKAQVNPLWLFSPDNQHFKRYYTQEDVNKKAQENFDDKRRHLMQELISNLKKEGLLDTDL